ncbi:retrovirus-related pol polyprotein from transposon TNT 1-94 [Tanacetum coccineum]
MSETVPPVPPPFGTSSGNPGSHNVNRVDMIPTTTDPINTTTTKNVSQSIDENLPQLLDSRGGSHITNVPAFTKRISRVRKLGSCLETQFNAFKSLEGEKVNGTFTRLKCLLNDLENNGVTIPQAEVNATDSDVKEDQRTNNEFMTDLNAEYHERALLANQKRFYKRSGRVGSARKPIDKTKETCFACGKTGHFQKDCPSNKTSTPSYPFSNNSLNKPKPYTPPFNQTSSQNTDNHQKDYKGKYKGLKAEMVVLTKRIDDQTKGKSEKGKNEKGKSEKGLIAKSFD